MEAGDCGCGDEYALGLFLFHLFWVNEASSIKLGINETYFDLWSMDGIEDLGQKIWTP